jgi:hypothetical protein
MMSSLSFPVFFDDDLDDADDFDTDFDEDFEFLSDEEFEVVIDDYDSDDFDISGDAFCLDDEFDDFGEFDSSEDILAEKGYTD